MKRRAAVFMLFLVVLVTLLGSVRQSQAGGVLLARVTIKDHGDLQRLAELHLQVLNFRHGQEDGYPLYILATEAQLADIEDTGIPVALIPGYLEGSTLYVLTLAGSLEPGVISQIYPRAAALVQEADAVLLMLPEPIDQQVNHLVKNLKILEPLPLFTAPNEAGERENQIEADTTLVYDPRIQEMIFDVTRPDLETLVAGLSGENEVRVNGKPYTILTRHSYAGIPINKATAYAEEYFRNLGLATDFEYYTPFAGEEWRNVIADQPGLTQPQKIILLTAHIDSRSEIPFSYAPGADDNATGTAGVMLAAKVLSQYPFEYTIRYILFTGEEQGHYGSLDYAAQMRASGANIRAVINLDMIGYNSDAYPVYEMHIRPSTVYPEDWAIATSLRDVVNLYNLGLTTEIVQDSWWISDHDSFWDYGYPAVWVFEDYQNFNPYYHTTNDQIEAVNMPYVRDIVRAAVGAAAHLAGVVDLKPTYLPGAWRAFSAGEAPQP